MERIMRENGVYLQRLEKIRRLIAARDLNGVILVPGPNLRYITGIKSLLLERPFLLFLPREDEIHLLAPTLESGPYFKSQLKIIVHSWDDGEGPSRAFEETVARIDLAGKWGLEGRVPFGFIDQILKHSQPQLENAESILQGIREIKDLQEIRLLQRAGSVLANAFEGIPKMLKAGMTELQLSRKISQAVYSSGAESVEDILVQSGEFAADPHHLPSARKLKRNESIVVDTACTFSGYYADITRTFMIGKNKKFEELYNQVLVSEEKAIRQSTNGVTVGSIDDAARNHLRQKALDRFFIHRTGHGLGLEVHEAPYIVPNGSEIVKPGMAFTIEPGVYLSGNMGIRIEDDIVSTTSKCKNLTASLPKEFGWWT